MDEITKLKQEAYALELIQQKFPNKEAVITEIMNLEAILHLPKATEHFVSDLHGEYPAFDHLLRNGSGNVKTKIQAVFGGRMTPASLQDFATLIYYPQDKLKDITLHLSPNQLEQWYLDTINHLLELLRFTATKYTRSKVRKALDPSFAYITEELLYTNAHEFDKRSYFDQLLKNLLNLKMADAFITATCYTIQRLVVDHLHVLGDIFDRGNQPDKIIDRLMHYHSVDIQWGNHDILWIGAASGSELCLLNLLRICARYNNLAVVEDAYGINLRHLATFAQEHYDDNPGFRPKLLEGDAFKFQGDQLQLTQIHQALAIMQFKLEKQVIDRQPDFAMENRLLLDKIDYQKQTITIEGHTYPLSNSCFGTVDAQKPYELLSEEKEIIRELVYSFRHSYRLRQHLDFIVENGSMYLRYNGNLLVHGCVPVDKNGNFVTFHHKGHNYQGISLLNFFDSLIRRAYLNEASQDDQDLLWYLWQGPISPLFGKQAMTTFERYFITDKATHQEIRTPYFELRKDYDFVCRLLQSFGLNPETGHVINGHTPVKRGHSGIMAQGKMLVIDGGYSKAYQKTTGRGGYTLLSNSYGLVLVSHHPFTSRKDAIQNDHDIISTTRVVNHETTRKLVADTDIGQQLQQKVDLLRSLLN